MMKVKSSRPDRQKLRSHRRAIAPVHFDRMLIAQSLIVEDALQIDELAFIDLLSQLNFIEPYFRRGVIDGDDKRIDVQETHRNGIIKHADGNQKVADVVIAMIQDDGPVCRPIGRGLGPFPFTVIHDHFKGH